MHINEVFLTKCSPVQLFTLEVEAEARGKAYLQALLEQFRRLGIGSRASFSEPTVDAR